MNMATTLPLPPTHTSEREESLVGNYFVAAYPPFSAWTASATHAIEGVTLKPLSAPEPIGIYVHIPFCEKKCDYCYYLSYVGQRPATVSRYLDSVVQELELYARRPAVNGRPLAFVYFGGGTPSILTNDQLQRLSSGLQAVMTWDGVPEVTFECAPRSVRRELLEQLRTLGVTRLSMGVQSFDDHLLKLNGRIHLAEDVYRAYNLIREVGFDWVNLDLMVGLIGETPEQWRDSVNRILDLRPESITVYQTEIPYNTLLYKHLSQGCLPASPVSWEIKRWRLDEAFSHLERAGYTVVSAYTAVRDPDHHRFQYQEHLWRGGDMLGLGVASFSYLQGLHFQNQVTLDRYCDDIARGVFPLKRAYELTLHDQLVREFILQLKFGEVSVPAFQAEFGVDIRKEFEQPLYTLMAEGYLSCTPRAVQLTCQGLLQADRLLPLFYGPNFKDARYC